MDLRIERDDVAVIQFAIKIGLALAFSGACAGAYRLLAKGRPNVRRETVWIFACLLVFGLIRVFVG